MGKHRGLIEQIQRMYDPENDTNPKGPRVTYVEISLLEIIEDLLDRVDVLETNNRTNEIANQTDY